MSFPNSGRRIFCWLTRSYCKYGILQIFLESFADPIPSFIPHLQFKRKRMPKNKRFTTHPGFDAPFTKRSMESALCSSIVSEIFETGFLTMDRRWSTRGHRMQWLAVLTLKSVYRIPGERQTQSVSCCLLLRSFHCMVAGCFPKWTKRRCIFSNCLNQTEGTCYAHIGSGPRLGRTN